MIIELYIDIPLYTGILRLELANYGIYPKQAQGYSCTCYISSLKSICEVVFELQPSKARIHQMYVTCHAPIGISYRGVSENLKNLEIFDQPYLCNRSTDFYGTKTKLYREVSSFGVCSKEIQENTF
jgi:hypothetical protein